MPQDILHIAMLAKSSTSYDERPEILSPPTMRSLFYLL